MSKTKIKRKTFRYYMFIFVFSFACVIGVRLFVAEICIVSSESMVPSIIPTELIVYNKMTYGGVFPRRWSEIPVVNVFTWISVFKNADIKIDWGFRRMFGFKDPAINDVVVFQSINSADRVVKRINKILKRGIPIKMNSQTKENILRIAELDARTIVFRGDKALVNGRFSEYYIPGQNFYYVLGDNSSNSCDSRSFGYITENHIIGKMGFILFSWDSNAKGINMIRWDRLFRFVR